MKIIAALLLLALTGCAVGPNYQRPSVAVAPAWKEQAPWRVASPQDAIPKGTWWSIFGDDELGQYEARAMTANQTIEIARNQLQQARASVRITQSGLFPQLNAGASAQRSRTSAGRPTASGIPLTHPITNNDFAIPFNLSWEADVFGGVRRSVESANAQYQPDQGPFQSGTG